MNILLGFGAFAIIIAIAILIPYCIALWKLFKKAGKNGWEAIIPFYSTWVLIEIAGLNWWYFLIAISGTIFNIIGIDELNWLTDLASIFVNFLCFYNIAKKTKQNEVLYGILGALISFVPVLILGFNKNINFNNTVAVSPNGIIGAPQSNKNTNNTTSNQNTYTNNTHARYCLQCGQRLNEGSQFCDNCGTKVE